MTKRSDRFDVHQYSHNRQQLCCWLRFRGTKLFFLDFWLSTTVLHFHNYAHYSFVTGVQNAQSHIFKKSLQSLCYVWQTLENFICEKEAAGFLNHCITHRQGLTLQTDLSENWLKSASRSHIRRPLRAAFAEYTGPIPFFVVPRLVGRHKRTEEQDVGKDRR